MEHPEVLNLECWCLTVLWHCLFFFSSHESEVSTPESSWAPFFWNSSLDGTSTIWPIICLPASDCFFFDLSEFLQAPVIGQQKHWEDEKTCDWLLSSEYCSRLDGKLNFFSVEFIVRTGVDRWFIRVGTKVLSSFPDALASIFFKIKLVSKW